MMTSVLMMAVWRTGNVIGNLSISTKLFYTRPS